MKALFRKIFTQLVNFTIITKKASNTFEKVLSRKTEIVYLFSFIYSFKLVFYSVYDIN